MFTLLHFGFEIFKIAIQAAVYTSIILILKFVLTKITGNDRLSLVKFRPAYFSIAGLLLIFSFTYYGDHGLGDEANIPLGYWKRMNSGDGCAFFYLKPDSQISVDSFLVRNDHLYFASANTYYNYQLEAGTWDEYKSKHEYETYASMHQLPAANEFKTFQPQYASYWNGWRFWFLP